MHRQAAQPHEVSDVGRRLKGILAQRNLTLAELAKASGVSSSALSLITRGKSTYPRTSTIQQISGALNLPPSALIAPSSQEIEAGQGSLVRGALVIPIVRIDQGDQSIDTGATTVVPSELLEGHARLLATVVNGGGFGPYVLPSDLVVFDPARRPEHGEMVVMVSGGVVFAAVAVADEEDGQLVGYQLADCSYFDVALARWGGVVVSITRAPPRPGTALRRWPG